MGKTGSLTRDDLRDEYRSHVESIVRAVTDGLLQNRGFMEGAKGPPGEPGPSGSPGPPGADIDWRLVLVPAVASWAAETQRRLNRLEDDKIARAKRDADPTATISQFLADHHEVVRDQFFNVPVAMCRAMWRQHQTGALPQASADKLREHTDRMAADHIVGARRYAEGKATWGSTVLVDEIVPLAALIGEFVKGEDE